MCIFLFYINSESYYKLFFREKLITGYTHKGGGIIVVSRTGGFLER